MPTLRWVSCLDDAELAASAAQLSAALARAGWRGRCPGVGGEPGADAGREPGADAVLVLADRPLPDAEVDLLLAAPGPVVLLGPTLHRADPDGRLATAAGLRLGAPTGVHDVRVRAGGHGQGLIRPGDHAHGTGAHLGEHLHVTDRVLTVEKLEDDVQPLLTAMVGTRPHPVATWRPTTRVLAWPLGDRAPALADPSVIRALLVALHRAVGVPDPAPVRVGLLGYGAIGHEHSRAVRHVDGLELAAVCDVSPQRLAAARATCPAAAFHDDPQAMLDDDRVDLLVVSTPPDSHAAWATAALRAGKHVVVEKPFAIRTAEADAVLDLARSTGKVAGVYQNRRFDPDHLAVRRAVRSGALGELFHLETFVGGYGHPCNLWHSDAQVSGGAFYDWGAHVLDQVLDLVADPVEQVSAVEHKLRWLDVTNADHARVTLRFAGGAEATFVYSDLAAALKPRWYVLGTLGAIVGHWRVETVVARSDIGTLDEDVLAPADSPPLLDLHAADGSVTRLATPAGPPYAYHAELADQLRWGLEPSVTGEQSRRVLAVMEAASRSARDGGRPVHPA